MRRVIPKLIFILFAAAVLSSCDEIKIKEETKDTYSIILGEFKSFDEADIYKSKIDFQIWNELKIAQADEKRFLLSYGNFKSSFDAGKKAFELFQKSIINNYKIARNNEYVKDLFANILFIGKYQGRPSVYNFNLLNKQSKLFWSRWGRKVMAVNYSADRNSLFILTALGYGKQGGFPYIKDSRLYFYDGLKDQVDEIDEFGDGLQLYSYWDNSDTFKVNITIPDSLNSDLLNQKIYSYDKTGKKENLRTRNFVLTRDGFPKPPKFIPWLYSANGTYQLRLVEDGEEYSVYLRDLKKKAEVLITSFNGIIKNLRWTRDEKFIFVIVQQNKPGVTGRDILLIIDTTEKKVARNFTGPIYKDLLVQGNLLFFDQQFEGVSQITIYDFAADMIYGEIQLPGGCGINDLSF